MLAFLSDLHITDRTTGVQHLSAQAFDGALRDLANHARKAASQHVEIVFLGDVFDLVRTTHWFSRPGSRPWDLVSGEFDSAHPVARETETLLRTIIEHDENRAIFDIWRGSLRDRYGFATEPTRVYVPGNHDRLCNTLAFTRRLCADALGIARDETQHFAPDYANADYLAFARHGHEWDAFNFEHSAELSGPRYERLEMSRYLQMPIGDVIAAEIASKLPTVVNEELRTLPQSQLSPRDRERIVEHFKTIDDVRPLAALIPWLLDSVQTQPEICRCAPDVLPLLTRAVQRVAREFDDILFARAWMRRHDTFAPFEAVDKLQTALKLLQTLDLETLQGGATAWESLMALFPGDNFAGEAAQEFARLETHPDFSPRGPLYVLYGHTHHAAQTSVEVLPDGRSRVYLNTGTWRPLARQSVTKRGFGRWKNLTYTILYHPERDPNSQAREVGYPIFETWTGSLLHTSAHQARLDTDV